MCIRDRIVVEGPERDAPAVVELMEKGPAWARGIPIKVEAKVGRRYAK